MNQHFTKLSVPLPVGRGLSDSELTTFAGGVTEGGCIPDPMKEVWKKFGVNDTTQQ